jgi:hypothetical protein
MDKASETTTQSGERYVLKVPSKGFLLAGHMLDRLTFSRRERHASVDSPSRGSFLVLSNAIRVLYPPESLRS